jgi:hypothetical protein
VLVLRQDSRAPSAVARVNSAADRRSVIAGIAHGLTETGGEMLSPKFLRMQAEKCLRSAQSTDDPETVAELATMARDLEIWASEAETEGKIDRGDRD